MSPRGVAIPQLTQQLFDAVERVLLRDGPGGLSGRAVTREAGVATGLLYNHFEGFNGFLGEFIVDRSRSAAEGVARLRSQVGEGEVIEHLTDAALAFGSRLPILTALIRSRPGLLAVAEREASQLDAIEAAFADYLEAEKDRGRVAPDADTPMLALALVATVHHLATAEGVDQERVRRMVSALVPRGIRVSGGGE